MKVCNLVWVISVIVVRHIAQWHCKMFDFYRDTKRHTTPNTIESLFVFYSLSFFAQITAKFWVEKTRNKTIGTEKKTTKLHQWRAKLIGLISNIYLWIWCITIYVCVVSHWSWKLKSCTAIMLWSLRQMGAFRRCNDLLTRPWRWHVLKSQNFKWTALHTRSTSLFRQLYVFFSTCLGSFGRNANQ